jgi:hypothetical protein
MDPQKRLQGTFCNVRDMLRVEWQNGSLWYLPYLPRPRHTTSNKASPFTIPYYQFDVYLLPWFYTVSHHVGLPSRVKSDVLPACAMHSYPALASRIVMRAAWGVDAYYRFLCGYITEHLLMAGPSPVRTWTPKCLLLD